MDQGDEGESTGIRLHTGGPLSAHHLLLHLARGHRVTQRLDPAEVNHAAIAVAALEV